MFGPLPDTIRLNDEIDRLRSLPAKYAPATIQLTLKGGTAMVEIDVPLVPEENGQYLNQKQRIDYQNHRQNFVEWCRY